MNANVAGNPLAVRVSALGNIAPLLKMVWQTDRLLMVGTLALRTVSAVLPLGTLWVAKMILDRVVAASSRGGAIETDIWWLIAIAFTLAAAADIIGRATSLCDALLSNRFSNEVSLRLMEHAGGLDLTQFEEPLFHDRLERARVQTTAGLGTLNGLARSIQTFITVLTLSASLMWYSPALVLLLLVAITPSFLGEAHFAMRSYALGEAVDTGAA